MVQRFVSHFAKNRVHHDEKTNRLQELVKKLLVKEFVTKYQLE